MKFYIPTSSLNMDNLLQSECILPMSHYAQRLTGYKFYEQIEELLPFDAIVLFKYPVLFTINDVGRYNYPVLIEFEDDAQTQDFYENEIQDGVCVCSHTLNLTPTNCCFYFFSEQAYKITIVNTQSNKSIKYYMNYSIVPNVNKLETRPFPKLVSVPHCRIGEYEDGIIDKQKGVLYAYLLGDQKSVNHDLAVQLRLTQDIYNILTNLISTPSSITVFGEKLSSLLDEYKRIDLTERNCIEQFEVNLKKELGNRFYFLKEYLIRFLKNINCWDYVFVSLCKRWECYFLPKISELHTKDNYLRLRSDIEKRTAYAVDVFQKDLPLSTLNDISMNGNAISIYNAPLVNAVINYIIKNKQTVEKLYANRLGFYMGAMETIVPILKEQMGEINWEKSKERAYINKLHAFINDQTVHFEINSIDNIELKSIAAFILKGQSYNDCVALCKMTEFENYRYVLSLWGSLCGYMEMNRDALSDILNMSTYSLVYEKIYGKNMGILSHNIANSESFINCCSEEIEKRSYKFSKEELSFILKSVNFKEVTQLVNKLESLLSVSSKPINECFEDAINETLSKKAKKQKELAWLSLKIYQSVDNYDVICTILKETNLSKTVQKNILKHFGYNEEKKVKIKRQETPSLFPEMNNETRSVKIKQEHDTPIFTKDKLSISRFGKSILDDKSWINECAALISDSRANRQFIEDMEWFVENHNKTYNDKKKGVVSGYYADHDRSNKRVLERLRTYMDNKLKPRNNKMQWLADIYANIPINKIMDYILRMYGI